MIAQLSRPAESTETCVPSTWRVAPGCVVPETVTFGIPVSSVAGLEINKPSGLGATSDATYRLAQMLLVSLRLSYQVHAANAIPCVFAAMAGPLAIPNSPVPEPIRDRPLQPRPGTHRVASIRPWWSERTTRTAAEESLAMAK